MLSLTCKIPPHFTSLCSIHSSAQWHLLRVIPIFLCIMNKASLDLALTPTLAMAMLSQDAIILFASHNGRNYIYFLASMNNHLASIWHMMEMLFTPVSVIWEWMEEYTSDCTYKDAHQPHLLLPSPEQWHPMNHQQVLQQASLKHIFEAVSRSASQLLFLLTAFSDTCEDKDLGHLSPSFPPVHSACEEAMTQKTNGPGSLTTTMISLSVIFLL